MKTNIKFKFLKIKLLKLELFLAMIFMMLIIVGFCSDSKAGVKEKLEPEIKIEYLKPIHLNISSNGINRLNFGDERVLKIVGDSSQYSTVLSDKGSDLFLTSKVPPQGIIDLTLMTAQSEAIDLRLHVNDSLEAAIIKVELAGHNNFEQTPKEEIIGMIKAMKSNTVGQYFVEERKS